MKIKDYFQNFMIKPKDRTLSDIKAFNLANLIFHNFNCYFHFGNNSLNVLNPTFNYFNYYYNFNCFNCCYYYSRSFNFNYFTHLYYYYFYEKITENPEVFFTFIKNIKCCINYFFFNSNSFSLENQIVKSY